MPKRPCPGLKLEPDGKATYCEIVRAEETFAMMPLIAMGLGIGRGCSMPDDYQDLMNARKPVRCPSDGKECSYATCIREQKCFLTKRRITPDRENIDENPASP